MSYHETLDWPDPGLHPYAWRHTPDRYLQALYAIVRIEQPELVVELGTYAGYSTNAMGEALLLNGHGRIVTIDWQQERAYQPPDHLRPIIRVECARTSDADARDRILAPDIRIDLLFIDASHDYESVSADLAAWQPYVRDGGLVCFHDIHGAEGVRRLWSELKQYHPGQTDEVPGSELGVMRWGWD